MSRSDASRGVTFCCPNNSRATAYWGLNRDEDTADKLFYRIHDIYTYPQGEVPEEDKKGNMVLRKRVDLPDWFREAIERHGSPKLHKVTLTSGEETYRLAAGTYTQWRSCLKFLCSRILDERETGKVKLIRDRTERTPSLPKTTSAQSGATEPSPLRASKVPKMPGDNRTVTSRIPAGKPNASNPPKSKPKPLPFKEDAPMSKTTPEQPPVNEMCQHEIQVLTHLGRALQEAIDKNPMSSRFGELQIMVAHLRNNAIKEVTRGSAS